MIFPIFASVVVFSVILGIIIKRNDRKTKKENEKFWEREAQADNTRKQSLDDLRYIVIPDEITNLFGEDEDVPEEISEPYRILNFLKGTKIVNFSNITNTDLKLMYGAANLPILTEYDQNYISLIRSLQIIGDYFYGIQNFEKAKLVLEYAVATSCDSMGIYKTLCDIYREENDSSKINYLLSTASLIPGITKGAIIRYITENGPTDKPAEESILDIVD